MISDWELWSCANELIRQKGSGALAHAVQRQRELHQQGDTTGAQTWLLIIERINELSRAPTAADIVN